MAVQLDIPQLSGVVANYHAISYVGVQPKTYLEATVSSYLDQAAAVGGATPLSRHHVPLDISAIDITQPLLAQLYAQLTAEGAMLFGGTTV